jgi:ZIP family zinc transporter
VCCSPDPVGDLERLQHQADELIAAEEHLISDNRRETTEHTAEEVDEAGNAAAEGGEAEGEREVEMSSADKEENKKLVKMGINTAIAIGIHNFPEGLATFVAALNDPRVGAVLAIAIGIHNIPEGLCVALPIYYATGNRMKAFGWALLSGASEPLAALLGWAVLANSFSDEMYAILFGLVSGMMIIISIRELLPTAHRYDPEDTVVTFSFIGGMIIMALSLVLFVL